MNDQEWLAQRLRDHTQHLRAVAYRMLGSMTEADDAIQEAWLRMSRADTSEVDNIGAWMTTVVARVSLNMLRSRNSRREVLPGTNVPDPIVEAEDRDHPEQEALLADSIGLALLVVLDALTPAERLAFVLHDMFKLPFDQIAPIVDRTPEATRQLASRARRRARIARPPELGGYKGQKAVVEAYLAASRDGNFERLVAVLDEDVRLRVDGGRAKPTVSAEVRGANAVAKRALAHAHTGLLPHHAIVNGAPGAIFSRDGEPFSVLAFTISGSKILEIDILADPERIARLDLSPITEDGT